MQGMRHLIRPGVYAGAPSPQGEGFEVRFGSFSSLGSTEDGSLCLAARKTVPGAAASVPV
ncbi:MAG: hypothetical protein K6G66_01840 [Oscillospiraceae bacterium]|nr:hypothetical protein [Oscillospiraceae bacterium]